MNDDPLVPDDLEHELRQIAVGLDPVPDALLRAAEGAYTWRTVGAELAELAFDSRADRQSLALVRGSGEPRLLTFHAGDLTIELEVSPAGAGHRLIGQLLPAGPAEVEVRRPDGTHAVEVDELGRFAAERVTAGPVSLRCRRAGRPVVTEWVTI